MERRIAVAACQMDAELAAKSVRLERAARLIEAAAHDGARLVALPELFNTGYALGREIVGAAEPIDGPTVDFLVDQAQRYGIVVAGSLLVRDAGEVFNALIVAGRDGRTWRYDKCFPWAWERSTFARGSGPVIAETELGRIGLMIGWDAAHPSVWADYAGRVQMIATVSCPLDVSGARYRLEDGRAFRGAELPWARGFVGIERRLFAEMVPEQAAWLGVPVVGTGACGRFTVAIPGGEVITALHAVKRPRAWSSVVSRAGVEAHGEPTAATLVDDAAARQGARIDVTAGETYVVSEVAVPSMPPSPIGEQPKSRVPKAALVLSDQVVPKLMEPIYASNRDRAHGVVPQDLATRLKAMLRPASRRRSR